MRERRKAIQAHLVEKRAEAARVLGLDSYQQDECTCDAFALPADRHEARCPVGRAWVLRQEDQ